MGDARRFVLPAVVIALASFVAGCSSSQERTSRGSLAVALGASRAAAGKAATVTPDDPVALLKSAKITVAGIEARRTDGAWIPLDMGLPAVVDLLALANGGRTVTLPAGLLSEGQYTALQLRITQTELNRLSGTGVTIAPPGAGWVVSIPVDFGVVSGQATLLELNVRVDLSFKPLNGEFEFEPEIEVDGVKHG